MEFNQFTHFAQTHLSSIGRWIRRRGGGGGGSFPQKALCTSQMSALCSNILCVCTVEDQLVSRIDVHSLSHSKINSFHGSDHVSAVLGSLSARPYESCKIFKGGPRRNAFSNLEHRQYKSFPPDRFLQVEIKNTTGLSNKLTTAKSCAEDQILENKISGTGF